MIRFSMSRLGKSLITVCFTAGVPVISGEDGFYLMKNVKTRRELISLMGRHNIINSV